MSKNDFDWCGKIQKKYRWFRFKFELGRYCYQTNACGDTLKTKWFFENK